MSHRIPLEGPEGIGLSYGVPEKEDWEVHTGHVPDLTIIRVEFDGETTELVHSVSGASTS